MNLKPNSIGAFTTSLEKEVIPMLRKQKGFQDEITFIVPDGTKVLAISLWDKAENADAYSKGDFTKVVQMLSKVVEGTPNVENYEVANSTFHKIASPAHV
jgi:heme-degrading monooxygenase HmoA